MYDNELFFGSDYWIDGLEWLEQNTKDKAKKLDLGNTLILLTSALAKDNNKGADYWYRCGVTAQLLRRLSQLNSGISLRLILSRCQSHIIRTRHLS